MTEEGHQIAEQPARIVRVYAHSLNDFRGAQHFAGHVKSHHGHLHATGEHYVRRFRIGPDVEFGGWGDIAMLITAAHEYDLLNLLADAWLDTHGHGDVG